MFGLSIVRTERLKELEKCERQIQTLVQVRYWFSGWRDLDIIWDYIFADTYFGSIGSCRTKYADARATACISRSAYDAVVAERDELQKQVISSVGETQTALEERDVVVAERDELKNRHPRNYVHKQMFKQVSEQRDAALELLREARAALQEIAKDYDDDAVYGVAAKALARIRDSKLLLPDAQTNDEQVKP